MLDEKNIDVKVPLACATDQMTYLLQEYRRSLQHAAWDVLRMNQVFTDHERWRWP